MKVKTLADVFVEQLQDMYSAETQLTKALPKMAKAASHEGLSTAFTNHLTETKEHQQTVGEILESLGKKHGRKKCAAMEGLVKEGAEVIEEDAEDDARDAGLVVAAQKVEHYEIASYGCLRTFATLLGHKDHARSLSKILEQEKAADVHLTELAMSVINVEALA